MHYRWKKFDIKKMGTAISLVVTLTGLESGLPASAEPAPETTELAASSTVRTVPSATPVPVVSGLSEQPRLINTCRFSPEQSLYIYEDAARTRLIRTLTAPTQGVFLTGIVGTGLAQIKDPILGWIGTEIVEPCTTPTPMPTTVPTPHSSSVPSPRPTTAPTPTPVPTPAPVSNICYEVREAKLTVRTTADSNSPALGVYGSGSVIYATTNPPRETTTSDGRIWTEINAPNGTGWVSRTGPNGSGDNALRLASDQCGS